MYAENAASSIPGLNVETERLEKEAGRCDELARRLVERLSAVLIPTGPTPPGDNRREAPMARSPLGERICGVASSLAETSNLIERLLSRLEV